MSGPVQTQTEEPRPVPEEPSTPAASPQQWVRENLFSTVGDSVLTVVFGAVLAYVLFRAGRYVFITARWDIIRANLLNFMVGSYPRDELFRVWIALGFASVTAGLQAGFASLRATTGWVTRLRRVGPPIVLVVTLLSFTRTVTPVLLAAVMLALGAAAYLLGRRLPPRASRLMPVVWIAGVALVFLAFTTGGVGWDRWGGLLLTLFLAVGGIVVAFPFGVLLALGRRSTFPAVRVVCVGYIELIRGVPLITLIIMSATMVGFFFPPGFLAPSLVTRGLIALVLFSAAYVAEIVRGGLQGVPKGQLEAAQAIGLSPIKTTILIILPQALRSVIPALVGQFISLFKDTSLISIIGVLEILRVAEVVVNQPDFQGQRLQAETLVFVSFVYWVFCYSMSRASQRLETRLGVGER